MLNSDKNFEDLRAKQKVNTGIYLSKSGYFQYSIFKSGKTEKDIVSEIDKLVGVGMTDKLFFPKNNIQDTLPLAKFLSFKGVDFLATSDSVDLNNLHEKVIDYASVEFDVMIFRYVG